MHGISNVGLARTVAGAVFPIGLMLIVLLGGELFTGNCLISMAVYDKKEKLKGMIRNLTIVYISNFIGAALMAWGSIRQKRKTKRNDQKPDNSLHK